MFNNRLTFRPSIESLEDRWCPSATATLANQGHTLVITGDASANIIAISQDDQLDKLTVTCDGVVTEYASSQITKIRAVLGRGADELDYSQESDTSFGKILRFALGGGGDDVDIDFAFGGPMAEPVTTFGDYDFRIVGGAGDDNVTAHLGAAISSNLNFNAVLGDGNDVATVSIIIADLWAFSHWRFLLDGNDGDDTLSMVAGNKTGGSGDVNVGINSSLDATLRGHGGKDTLFNYYRGTLDGSVSMHQSGGRGADFMGNDSQLNLGSDGTFDAFSAGGRGGDVMNMDVIDNSAAAAVIQAQCNGGPGNDTANTTGPVTTVNVP